MQVIVIDETSNSDTSLHPPYLPNELTICHLNEQSMLPKHDEISDYLLECTSPTILGISETLLTSSVTNAPVTVDGYTSSSEGTEGREEEVESLCMFPTRSDVGDGLTWRGIHMKPSGLRYTHKDPLSYSVTSMDHQVQTHHL